MREKIHLTIDKKGLKLFVFVLGISLLLFLIGYVVLSELSTDKPSDTDGGGELFIQPTIPEEFKYNEGFYWDHMPITYSINTDGLVDSLVELRTEQFRDATDRLTERVPSITFEEVDDEELADIRFYSLWYQTDYPNPQSMYSFSFSNVSFSGKIIQGADIVMVPIGPNQECFHSNMALHRLLNAFGVGDDSSVLMNFEDNCYKMRMDDTISDYLKDIYILKTS